MKYYLTILFAALSAGVHSQSFLNGDFENNSALQCEFNLANSDYSSKMSNSWAFGSGEEVDIQTFVCGYETPPTGNWFVSLSKDTDGNCDAISLELTTNLIAGNQYEISYFSSALMGNTGLRFGLSEQKDDFGQPIFASQPLLNNWVQKAHTFIAPNNGKYITVTTDCASPSGGWNLIDNLQMTPTLGVENHDRANSVTIFPNPSAGHFTIATTANISQVMVFNAIGQLVKTKETAGLTEIGLDLDANGVYLVTLKSGNSAATKKIVVSH